MAPLAPPNRAPDRERRPCPHCRNPHVWRWGASRGRPRYRCPRCRRTFGPTTGTPLAYLKRSDRWPHLLACMQEGLTLAATAARLDIHVSTAFRWRHRFLAALRARQQPVYDGYAEIAEVRFRYSQKGRRRAPDHPPGAPGGRARVCALLVRDRHRRFFLALQTGPNPHPLEVARALAPVFRRGASLCAPRPLPYAYFCRAAGVTLRPAGSGSGARGGMPLHPPTGRIVADFRRWLKRFRGVATRYLVHYWTWFAWTVLGVRPAVAA